MRLAKWIAALCIFSLAAVGAVGSWHWADARIHPPPPQAPELARDLLPPGPSAPALVSTQLKLPTREETIARAKEFGLELHRTSDVSYLGKAPELSSMRGQFDESGKFRVGSLDYPVTIALAEFGPGPRGDTGKGWCYVPAEGAPGELRIKWTSPLATLAEAAGCAAVRGAEKVEEAAQKAKAAADEIAAKLGAEMRYSLRAGPGIGTGGYGVLVMGSIDGRTRHGRQLGGVGMVWISREPAAAAALTIGLDRAVVGKN